MLPALADVDFQFCPAVGPVDFLAQMKTVKKVRFWGCSDRKKTVIKAIPLPLAKKIEVDSELLVSDDDDD